MPASSAFLKRNCPSPPSVCKSRTVLAQSLNGLSCKLFLHPLADLTLTYITQREARRFDVEFLIGFELEFILLKNTTTLEPVNRQPWCCSLALPSGSDETKAMEEIVDNLALSGVEVQSYHPEVSPGQYEVVTGPLPTMEAVDVLIHTRETIFHVANKYGLRATFVPRPFPEYSMFIPPLKKLFS
jgi:glutamine synthetase